MCTNSFFWRFGAFVAALILCLALSVPAFADEVLTGNSIFDTVAIISGSPSLASNTLASDSANKDFSIYNSCSRGAFRRLQLGNVSIPSDSSAGIYLSFCYGSMLGASQSKAPNRSDFGLQFYNISSGSTSLVPVSSVSLFEPNISWNSKSDGVSIVARAENSLGSPKSSFILYALDSTGSVEGFPAFYFAPVSGNFEGSGSNRCIVYVFSYRVVSAASNAELDALESMASNIAAQNQILSQFYGDIVAVCNQIYQRLGDLQAAQEEANRLFSNVISLLNTTNGKLEAINMAMSTYFELLINQLKQEGIDTRSAIADAEARLELYLKPMIDYFNELEEQTGESASSLPKHKTDIDGFNNEGFGIDSDGQVGLAAILPILSAFSFVLSILGIFIGLGVLGVIIKKGAS